MICCEFKSGYLQPEAWNRLLPENYPDRDFIMSGVQDGFHVIDLKKLKLTTPVKVSNYKSATVQHQLAVSEQIKEEMSNGRYIISNDQPMIVFAIGAIPKRGSSKVRIIHDCSRPDHFSVNELADCDKFKY